MKKFFTSLLKETRGQKTRVFSDHKQEILIRQGREQFKKLLEKGLSVPVALL